MDSNSRTFSDWIAQSVAQGLSVYVTDTIYAALDCMEESTWTANGEPVSLKQALFASAFGCKVYKVYRINQELN